MEIPVERLGEGRWLRLVRAGRWEWVERVNTTGIVLVVAVTDDGELICVEQYRPAVHARVIDLPAGLAGDLGPEELETAAARELEEETGFRAERFERLYEVTPSPGLCNEIVTIFQAHGLTRVSEGGGDESESIDVTLVPLASIREWADARVAAGTLVDAKFFTGVYFAERNR